MEKTVTKLEYTEKHHAIEVDGVEYEIPQRTGALDELIQVHDEKIKDRTEYENNYDVLCILFGDKNAKKMFPDKKTTNLDKLSKCVKLSMALYYADYHAMQSEELQEKIKAVKPTLDMVNKASKAANFATTRNFVSKKRK